MSPALAQVPPTAAEREGADLDVTRVLVLSNAEYVAMGGAGIAFAAGGPGMAQSPASPANRRTDAVAPLLAGVVFLRTRTDAGIGNLGKRMDEDVWMLNAGLAGGLGRSGAGALVAAANYQAADRVVTVVEGHASLAMSLGGGKSAVGIGPRLLGMWWSDGAEVARYFGVGMEVGIIVPNLNDAWSFALTARSGVSAHPPGGTLDGVTAARLPPQLVVGGGWSNLARVGRGGDIGVPVRIVADLVLDGSVPDAASLENLLQSELVARGEWATVSPHLGGEVDVWPGHLRLRAGTYLEPSRTVLAEARPHLTGGFELRVVRVRVFGGRIDLDLAWQVGVDTAADYFRGAWFGLDLWQHGLGGGAARITPPEP